MVATTALVFVLFLAAVGVYQGLAPFGCHVVDGQSEDAAGSYDGRRCDTVDDCRGPDIDPNAEYACEKVGVLGTSSIGGRVRYRGSFGDPNELAMVVALGLPFAFGLFMRRPGFGRGLFFAVALALIGGCVVYTQSRGALLICLATVATYVVQGFGYRGLLAVALAGIAGVYGLSQLLDWPAQEAQRSYVLVATELGFPGLVAWVSVLYLSAKIALLAIRRYGNDPSTEVARSWAVALLAELMALCVGVFFQSFAYHQIFWIMMGLCGAFLGACRAHDEGFEVSYGWRDLLNVVAGCGILRLAAYFYAGWQSR